MIVYLVSKGRMRRHNGSEMEGYLRLDFMGYLYYRLGSHADPHENFDSELWDGTEE